jgi:hypothetical protein
MKVLSVTFFRFLKTPIRSGQRYAVTTKKSPCARGDEDLPASFLVARREVRKFVGLAEKCAAQAQSPRAAPSFRALTEAEAEALLGGELLAAVAVSAGRQLISRRRTQRRLFVCAKTARASRCGPFGL